MAGGFDAINGTKITAMLYSFGSSIGLLILGLIVCGALIYFLFLKRKVRKWGVNIYEAKDGGVPVLVERDIIAEKFYNNNKQVCYMLRKNKTPVLPPNHKLVYRVGNKDWCDYMRIEQAYIPFKKQVQYGLDQIQDKAEYMVKLNEIAKMNPKDVDSKYIYAPFIPTTIAKFNVDLMEYDVSTMMFNMIDDRDKHYADKKGFFEKYGGIIVTGLIVVSVIVIAYLSFDFIVKVQANAMQPFQTIGNNLKELILNCGGAETNAPPI